MSIVTIAKPRPPASAPPPPQQHPENFEQQAPRVLRALRSAVSELIETVEGDSGSGPIRKATELERALKIPTTLAWKVFTFTQADDPLSQVAIIPGAEAMKKFFDAAGRAGANAKLVAAARAAFAEFDDLVRVHAGSRSTLDSMISGLKDSAGNGGGGSDQMDLQQKRAAYKAYSHIWGVQAQTQLSCFIFRPSEADPTQLDMVGVRGLVGLRRLRRDASWIISHARLSDDDGKVRRPVNRTPIDPLVDETQGVSLLNEFCSQPLPRFRNVPAESGFVNTELESTAVGNQSAVTCLMGDVFHKVFTRFRDEHNQEQRTQSMVRTPCEALVHDVLVEAGSFSIGEGKSVGGGRIAPRVLIYGDHRDVDPALAGRECDLLALRETVTYLGRGPAVLSTSDVPRYAEMVRYALDRAEWDAEKFDVYRCRVEYPVMPSSVVVQFDLPEKP